MAVMTGKAKRPASNDNYDRLYQSIKQNDKNTLNELLEKNNDLNLNTTMRETTPLSLATKLGHTEIALSLINHGANFTHYSAIDNPLYLACIHNNHDLLGAMYAMDKVQFQHEIKSFYHYFYEQSKSNYIEAKNLTNKNQTFNLKKTKEDFVSVIKTIMPFLTSQQKNELLNFLEDQEKDKPFLRDFREKDNMLNNFFKSKTSTWRQLSKLLSEEQQVNYKQNTNPKR